MRIVRRQVKRARNAFDLPLFSSHHPWMIEPAIQIVCSWCGSLEVSRDAWADWDVERQSWVLGATFDDGYCHRCERERGLAEQQLIGSVTA